MVYLQDMSTLRFAMAYDKLVLLQTIFGGGPRTSGAEVDGDQVRFRMGAVFSLAVPRSSIRSALRSQAQVGGTRGVHGGAGRWLVNGSADGLVEVRLDPPGRTRPRLATFFRPARVEILTLSLVDPDGFIAAVS